MNEWIILALIGLAAGSFGGMVGLGGGVIMIPAMVLFLKLTQHQAQGISLTVMLPPVSIFAVYNYWKSDYDPRFLTYSIIIALFFVIGGYFGSKLAVNLSNEALRKIFAISMIILALNMLFGNKICGSKPKISTVQSDEIQATPDNEPTLKSSLKPEDQ